MTTIKEQIAKILEAPGTNFENLTITGSHRLSPSEERLIRLLAHAYKKSKNEIIRRLIRQAAIDYSQDGECIALLSYTHEDI